MVEEKFAGVFVAGDVSELVAYHQIVVYEPIFKRAQGAILTRLPDLSDQPGHGSEHDGHSVGTGLDSQSRGQMGLAGVPGFP